MRAPLLGLLVTGALTIGSAFPAAQAMDKREMRDPTPGAIVAFRHQRAIVAERRLLPFHALAQARPRSHQPLAPCCIGSIVSPEAGMIVVTEDTAPQLVSPESEQPAAAQPAATSSPHAAPTTETVAGVTVMRGSVAQSVR